MLTRKIKPGLFARRHWCTAWLPSHDLILTTALSQMTDIRSSTPLVPSGMAVKLSFPIAFWAVLKVQWALPESCRSPLAKEESSTWMGQVARGTAGAQTQVSSVSVWSAMTCIWNPPSTSCQLCELEWMSSQLWDLVTPSGKMGGGIRSSLV